MLKVSSLVAHCTACLSPVRQEMEMSWLKARGFEATRCCRSSRSMPAAQKAVTQDSKLGCVEGLQPSCGACSVILSYLGNPRADFLKTPCNLRSKTRTPPEGLEIFGECCLFTAFLVENDSKQAKTNRNALRTVVKFQDSTNSQSF